MMKRILALLVCALTVLPCLVSCGSKITDDNPGAIVNMYLGDDVFDLDPINAYTNASALKTVSLLFSTLFRMTDSGKIEKELVKEYTISEDANSHEYKMTITLRDDAFWDDGSPVSASDVVFTWKYRILQESSTNEAAVLLYPIKNAKLVKQGDISLDALQIYAINPTTLEVFFEEKLDEKGKPAIDYDGFIRNMTSYALAPLRETIVSRTSDWAKKAATMSCSGPFKLRRITFDAESVSQLILERNPYYLRNKEKDSLDKSVTPYRLVVDYTLSDDEIMEAYEAGEIFYVGEIPLSYRADYAKKAKVTDALSTHAYYLNENAEIGGTKLFANPAVRKALSLAIDRDAIAEKVVFAEAATALVPTGVFETDSFRKTFRSAGDDLLATSANMDEAKRVLAEAGIDPSKYSFEITVASYDNVHVTIAAMIASCWDELGFDVYLDMVDVTENDDIGATQTIDKEIRDDDFQERFVAGDYEVAAIDLVSFSTDAMGVLAPFAVGFSGQAMNMNLRDENNQPYYIVPTHVTGYSNEEYTALIEKANDAASLSEKASLLHEAEALLMEDLPVIPVIFNKDAYLQSKILSGVKSTMYGTRIFTKLNQKNWEKYLPEEE